MGALIEQTPDKRFERMVSKPFPFVYSLVVIVNFGDHEYVISMDKEKVYIYYLSTPGV